MKKRSRIWQPWFLAALLAVGFCFTWVFTIILGATLFRNGRLYDKDIRLLSDGTLAVVSYGAYGHVTFETLDGKPIETPKNFLRGTFYSYGYGHIDPPSPWNRLSWNNRLLGFADDPRESNTLWYLIYDGQLNGKAYFVGYDAKSRQLVGYLGKNGFDRNLLLPDDYFPINGRRGLHGQFTSFDDTQSYMFSNRSYRFNDCFENHGPCYVVYLLSDGQLLQINLRNRSVRTMCKLPGVKDIVGTRPPKGPPKEGSQHEVFDDAMFAARTDREILFLDSNGKEVRRWTIPESLRGKAFQFTPLNKTTGVAIFQTQLHRKPMMEYHFVWFDNQGAIQRKESPELPSHESWQGSTWYASLACPMPVLLTPSVMWATGLEYLSSGEATDWPSALAAVLADDWPPLLVTFLLSVVLAWFCWRRQKRYDQPWTWVWVVSILLFGVPAMIGYLFHRRWPAIEPCPNCEKEAPRDRPACYACGQDFPHPAMKGTEIFA